MKNILIILIILSNIGSLRAQNSTLKLLDGFEYRLNNKSWEIDSNKTVNTPYHSEFILQKKEQVSKLRVRINSMDYLLKDSLYSNLEVQKRTALEELESFKKEIARFVLKNDDMVVTYLTPVDYKGFKIMVVIIQIENDKVNNGILSVGVKVINDYLVVGASVENMVNSTPEESINLLKMHLKRIKKSSCKSDRKQ
jgi:ribosome biogenesis protein Nip4